MNDGHAPPRGRFEQRCSLHRRLNHGGHDLHGGPSLAGIIVGTISSIWMRTRVELEGWVGWMDGWTNGCDEWMDAMARADSWKHVERAGASSVVRFRSVAL